MINNKVDHLRQSRQPGKEIAHKMYEEILDAHSNKQEAERYLFQEVGSGSGSDYLLTHHEEGCGSWWEGFSKRYFACFYILKEKRAIALPLGFLHMVGKSYYYLLDIMKDVNFLVLLSSFDPCPIWLIVIGVLSLSCSETAKIWYLYSQPGASKAKKLVYCLFSPVIHVLIHTEEFILEVKYHNLASNKERSAQEDRAMAEVRGNLHENLTRKSELRCSENVLEHFVQLILSILILNLPGYGESLTYSSLPLTFIFLSALLSVVSIANGQVGLIKARKNKHLGLKDIIVLIFYFGFAIIPRVYLVYSALSFFSPLFEDEGKLGYTIAVIGPTIVTCAVCFGHVAVSFAVQTRYLKAIEKRLTQALWTLLAPPLFLDWDTLSIQLRHKIPIGECWHKTQHVYNIHNALTFIGNGLIGMSLFLAQHFNQSNVDSFSAFLVLLSILSQISLIGLSQFYFKSCHPWATLLVAELDKMFEQPQHGEVEEEAEAMVRREVSSNPALYKSISDQGQQVAPKDVMTNE